MSFSLDLFKSIKGKLILAFLGVSLLPITLVTIIASTQTQKNIANLVGGNFDSTAHLMNTEMENWITERK